MIGVEEHAPFRCCEGTRSVYPNPVSFFATHASQKNGRAPAVTARPEEAFTTHLPVLTQIEMVFHENSFGASLTPYSSGF